MRASRPCSKPILLAILAAVCLLVGCAPPPSDGETPDLTKSVIDERINDARVFDVPPENGQGEPISWRFDEREPKEITVIDEQVEGKHATIILDIKTRGSLGRAKNDRELAGQIKTEWELKSNLVLRRWEIVWVDNISMKYKDVPKPEGPGKMP